MKWLTYSEKFSKTASLHNFTNDEIETLLSYAACLFKKRIPIIYDQEHFSHLVGYKYDYLLKISNAPQKFYRHFEIPKKNGGSRSISEPLPSLKEIQHWILTEILNKCPVSGYAKAYIRNRSIRKNAEFHVKRKIVLTIDIQNFFPSLQYTFVHKFFANLGYSLPVTTLLSNICCLNDGLPQGAPTSPALSNLLMVTTDKRIGGFIKKNDIYYTRYADDMAFSGDFEPGTIIKFVNMVLQDMGLNIHDGKVRVRKPSQRQQVTGVVVNEKIQAPKALRKRLRQAIYYIEKFGLVSHLEKTKNTRANHIYHLLGIANFILFLNPEDKEVQNYRETLRKYILEDR